MVSVSSRSSTQVNMDEEYSQQDRTRQKRRDKKKQYKRKKKEKTREEERTAKVHLAEIIDLVYQGELTVAQCEEEVHECLEALAAGDKFHCFLNEAIRAHVSDVQQEIWRYMQALIQQNPCEKFDEDQNFYLRMVDKIYEEYRQLRSSSQEVEKIINMFMCLTGEEAHSSACQNLDRSTFSYLLESDDSIRNLIRICERRISIRHQKQVLRLREIAQLVEEAENCQVFEDEVAEKSTSAEEEDAECRKHRKKKKKLQQAEFSTHPEDVLSRLHETTIIDGARAACRVQPGWLDKMAHRYGP